MRTRRDFVTWLSALSLAGLARPLAADAATEDEAEHAAREWLDGVDQGRYAESWDEAAPILKSAVSKDQWVQTLTANRAPLGPCVSRIRVSRKLVDSFRGGPKGPYLVVQLESGFEKTPAAVETVTPALGADGRWRVSGYFIR